ncbi:hypothetical protein H0H93_009957 [Arthromyces matolae]|nr:hypothetical protein H0H93_009957 [Arthromyces matolae]
MIFFTMKLNTATVIIGCLLSALATAAAPLSMPTLVLDRSTSSQDLSLGYTKGKLQLSASSLIQLTPTPDILAPELERRFPFPSPPSESDSSGSSKKRNKEPAVILPDLNVNFPASDYLPGTTKLQRLGPSSSRVNTLPSALKKSPPPSPPTMWSTVAGSITSVIFPQSGKKPDP